MQHFQLYVTEQAPNGTHDLIIADLHGQIIDSLPEALFGLPMRWTTDPDCVADGDEIYPIPCDDDGIQDMEWAREQGALFNLTTWDLAKYVARSPTNNGSEALAMIKKYQGK